MEQVQPDENIRYGQQEVSFLLHDYLDYMKTHGKFEFAACTDEQALAKLGDAANVGNAMEPMNRIELARVLSLSSMPEHVGSRFLADVLKDSKGYGTRSRLAQHAIKAFTRIALDKTDAMNEKTRFVNLRGTYQPDAYVDVVRMECPRKKDEADTKFNICTVYPCHDLVPLIIPNDGVKPTGKVLPGTVNDAVIVHRDDVKLYRSELAEWGFGRLKSSKDEPPKIDAGKLLQKMLELGDMQLERFKSKYFQNLGQYEAMYLANEKAVEKPNPVSKITPSVKEDTRSEEQVAAAARGEEGQDENGKF